MKIVFVERLYGSIPFITPETSHFLVLDRNIVSWIFQRQRYLGNDVRLSIRGTCIVAFSHVYSSVCLSETLAICFVGM